MSLTISEQIARRGQGQAPSQLNAQRVPIYGDKATATSETKPLTWRLAHHDAVLDLSTYESLKGFTGLKEALSAWIRLSPSMCMCQAVRRVQKR